MNLSIIIFYWGCYSQFQKILPSPTLGVHKLKVINTFLQDKYVTSVISVVKRLSSVKVFKKVYFTYLSELFPCIEQSWTIN